MIKSMAMVRLSALGDVLMMVPLVRTIQDNMPHTELTWIISRPAFDLVEGMNGVEFIVMDKPKNALDYWRFKRQMSDRRFDVLLAPQASLRTNLLYPLIRAKRKIGYDAKRAKDGHGWFIKEQIAPANEHTVDGFLGFASSLGIQNKVIRWDMPLGSEDFAWADHHLPTDGLILLVNPAASKPERSWPVACYIELLQRARHQWPVHVVLTGGPGAYDRELADKITSQVPHVIDLVGKTKPKQLLAVISRATVVVCPDTGPSHMAAAMNTPVVALHAVTNPAISGPYTFRHLVINRYPDAAAQVLNVPYEQLRWGTQIHGHDAMKLITVDDVMTRLSGLL